MGGDMGGEGEDQHSPFLTTSPSSHQSDYPFQRTGIAWTANAMVHIITGVIGAGVLSLAGSVAQLGWTAGPLLIITFAAITLLSAYPLYDCYRYPHPESGPSRTHFYMEAAKL